MSEHQVREGVIKFKDKGANGETRSHLAGRRSPVLRGSHLAGRHPDKVLDAEVNTIAAEGPPGCAIVTDGRIWHGTGSNQTDIDRNAILITYCGPQFRPQENYTIGTRLDVLSNASDRLRELLGLRVWCGYGRTGDPTVDFVDPTAEQIGELKLD